MFITVYFAGVLVICVGLGGFEDLLFSVVCCFRIVVFCLSE